MFSKCIFHMYLLYSCVMFDVCMSCFMSVCVIYMDVHYVLIYNAILKYFIDKYARQIHT